MLTICLTLALGMTGTMIGLFFAKQEAHRATTSEAKEKQARQAADEDERTKVKSFMCSSPALLCALIRTETSRTWNNFCGMRDRTSPQRIVGSSGTTCGTAGTIYRAVPRR